MSSRPPFSYTVDTGSDAGAQVLTLQGKLMGTPEAYDMLETTRERIQAGQTRVQVMMAGVTLINSSGAGILAAMHTSAARQEGSVVLIGLSPRARKVIETMNLDRLIEVSDDLDPRG